jgi:hypothetical protein
VPPFTECEKLVTRNASAGLGHIGYIGRRGVAAHFG